MTFDEDNASAEQLWDYYGGNKYHSSNPVARLLTAGFFRGIGRVLAELPADFRLLEVGCGPGESTRKILERLNGQYLEASEFEQRLVDLHRERGFPVTLSQESVYAMQRADDEFDCVILLEVLEHLEDFEAALAEIFRVARHSVLVSVPHEPWWRLLNFMRGKYWSQWGNTPGHINHWNRRQFVELIAGFGPIISVHSPLPWTIVHAAADR